MVLFLKSYEAKALVAFEDQGCGDVNCTLELQQTRPGLRKLLKNVLSKDGIKPVPCGDRRRLSLLRSHGYLCAHTSIASTLGFFVRAFRVVRSSPASRNPEARNSSRKAPPSLAPAIQANQSSSVSRVPGASGSLRTSSAAYTRPPRRMTRASS